MQYFIQFSKIATLFSSFLFLSYHTAQSQCSVDAGSDFQVCNGEQITLTANASGGDGNYTYFWNVSFGFGQSQTFTPIGNNNENLTQTYTVTLLDGSGCVTTDDIAVTVLSNPEATASVSQATCTTPAQITFEFGDHPNRTGIEFSLNGGSSYQSSVPDNSGSVSYNVNSGTVSAWVRWGNNQCPQFIGDFTVDPGPGPSMEVEDGFNACEGTDYTFSPIVSGGTPPYSYTWNDGTNSGTGLDITFPNSPTVNQNVNYELTVEDDNGCVNSGIVTVNVRSNPTAVVSINNKDCFIDGSLTFSFNDHPNRGNIEFSTDGGSSYYSGVPDNSGSVTYNLDPGIYDCFVRWGNNECPIDLGSYEILNNGGYTLDIGGNVEICDGEEIVLSPVIDGAALNPVYSWTYNGQSGTGTIITLVGDPTQNITHSLEVTATDDNGCSATDAINVRIESIPEASILVQNKDCFNPGSVTFSFADHQNRGAIEFSIDGGNSYFNQVADNSGSVTYNLDAGVYNAFVRWGNNECPVDLGSFEILDDGTSISLDLNMPNTTTICLGEEITVNPTLTGGTAPFNYTWTNGTDSGTGLTFTPSGDPSVDVNHTYSISVSDANGCTDTRTANVRVRSLPTVTNVEATDGCASNGGITFSFDNHPNRTQIEFSTDGGSTYYSSVSDANGSVTYNLSAGDYSCFVRWGNTDCPVELGNYNIEEPSITLDLGSDLSTCDGEEITLTPTVTGGTVPYTYTWDNGAETGTGLTFTTLGNPNMNVIYFYSFTLTDANGCEANSVIGINVISTPQVNSFGALDGCLGDAEVNFTFSDHLNFSALQFSLDGGSTYSSDVADDLGQFSIPRPAGTYSTFARWPDGSCPVDLGTVEILDSDTFYSTSSGNADDPIWRPEGGTVPMSIEFCADRNLVIVSGHTIMADKLILANKLTIETNATLDLSEDNYSVELKGDFVNNGNLQARQGLFRLSGSAVQRITGVPTKFHDLEINNPAGVDLLVNAITNGTVFPESGAFDTNGNDFLLISEPENGDILTGAIGEIKPGADFIGDIEMQRYVESLEDGYRLIGVPILNQTVGDFQGDFMTTGYPGADYPSHSFTNVKFYEEPLHAPDDKDEGFVDVTSTSDLMDNEKGYWAYFPPSSSASILNAEGEFRKGDVTFNLSHTETGPDEHEGWNCIPNPYPCAIDMMSGVIDFVNTDRAIYILNHTLGGTWKGEYMVYNNGVSVNGGSNLIASYQAFFVKANGPGASITFRELSKTTEQGIFYRTQEVERPLLRLSLNRDEVKYEAVVAFHDDADETFNSDFDAYKQPSTMFSLATQGKEALLSINTLTSYRTELEIPVNVYTPEAGEYILGLDEIQNIQEDLCLFIRDELTGEEYPLGLEANVVFTSEEGYQGNRFTLVSKPGAFIRVDSPSCAHEADGFIEVAPLMDGPFNFTLTDDGGNLIAQQSQTGNTVLDGIASGVYQLHLESETETCGTLNYNLEVWETPELPPSSVSYLKDNCDLDEGKIFISADHDEEMIVQIYMDGELVDETTGQELIIFQNLNGGVYDVEVITECGEENHSVDIENHDRVVADFELSESEELFNGEAVITLTSQSQNSIQDEWYLGDEFLCHGEICTVSFTEEGVYDITLVSQDADCSKDITKSIEISSFDVNDDEMKEDFSLGINDFYIQIQRTEGEKVFDRVEVFDVKGRLIETNSTRAASSYFMNHSDYNPGVYILRLSHNGHTIHKEKFVK